MGSFNPSRSNVNNLTGSGGMKFDTTTLIVDEQNDRVTIGDDLRLVSDSSVLAFGADSEITLTHAHNVGLNLKRTATGDGSPVVLTLQTGEEDIAEDDVIARINFQAPDEDTGTDANLVCAGIAASSEGDFAADNNATTLSFATAASAAATAKLFLKSDGKLGVGLAGPGAPLHVYGDSGGAGYAAMFQNDGNNANRYGMKITAGADNASGTTYYILCADGDGGTIGFIANTSGTFALTDPSDARIKNNIRITAINGLEIINAIQVRDFEMKKSGISKTGFVAQELKGVYPAAVTGEENDVDDEGNMMPMGIAYANLIPALVKSIQELTERVAELENK